MTANKLSLISWGLQALIKDPNCNFHTVFPLLQGTPNYFRKKMVNWIWRTLNRPPNLATSFVGPPKCPTPQLTEWPKPLANHPQENEKPRASQKIWRLITRPLWPLQPQPQLMLSTTSIGANRGRICAQYPISSSFVIRALMRQPSGQKRLKKFAT